MTRKLLLSAALLLGACAAATSQPSLSIQTGVQIGWPTSTNDTYQPQWSAVGAGTWNNLTNSMPGTGGSNYLFDPSSGGARHYQVLEMVPAVAAAVSQVTNGGFEAGSGTTASGWTVAQAAGGPVYAVRTNDNPHTGSFNFEVHLASTGAGPVVEVIQTIAVTGGTSYPFTFYADALSGSTGDATQWRVQWNSGGDTGYVGYTPGNNSYAFVSNNVMAPPSATSAIIHFYFAGSAVTTQSATVQLDDVVFGTAGSGTGTPGQTNVLQISTQNVFKLGWPTASGVQYQLQSSSNLAPNAWSSLGSALTGDGGPASFMFPMTGGDIFYRLQIPAAVILPPSNLQNIASGSTNAIGLAWTASPTPNVTGYRIFYGTSPGSLTSQVDVGDITSAIIAGLVPGQTYYLAVMSLAGNGQSDPTAAIAAQTDTSVGIVALFNVGTALEPETTVDTPSAVITYLGDRARDRHARESQFMLYDHYLSWYWQQRIAAIQIVDYVAKGGSNIVFNYTTQGELNPAEFRTFFRGITTVAEYQNNQQAVLVSTNVSAYTGFTDFNYTASVSANAQFNRPLQIGDRVEIEISQFLLAPLNGRANYYGTVLLYVVGQGIVPWEEGSEMGLSGVVGNVNTGLDSYPMPTNGWLGGKTTLPYQYSDEPTNHFKELAGNISPTNAQLFMLGRRLFHTDFGDGSDSEPDNPIYTEQVGKLGPKYQNRSCVACHANDGRALPPAIGVPLTQYVIKVGSDANGTPDPVLGSELQMESTSGPGEGTVTIGSYTTNSGTYGDGTPYSLQKPNYVFSGYTPAFFSVRIAPQLVGMGLLEAISESNVLAMADPNDANQDGISGRPQVVIDPQTGQQRLGRFGYKAGKPRVSHQVASALNGDMGVTSSIFPVLDGGTNAPGSPELADTDLDNLTRYISLLGVSARRSLANAQALHGEQLFAGANCVQCHTPTLTTSPYHPMTELRNQVIHPYTDLLLHDMGPGLADNMGELNATGSEWRTPPLWSIGLTAGICGGEAYLHDGRARSLEEAILWHGGEAQNSREAFRNMSASDRAALIAFLQSL